MVLSAGATGVVRSATAGLVDGVFDDGVLTDGVALVPVTGFAFAAVPFAGSELVSVVATVVVVVVSEAGVSAGRLSPQATTPSVHATTNNAFFICSLLRSSICTGLSNGSASEWQRRDPTNLEGCRPGHPVAPRDVTTP